MYNPSLMNEQELALVKSLGIQEETLDVLKFSRAPCIIAEGNLVSRHLLVKYISNVLGGAHHDSRRSRKKTGAIFTILDRAAEKLRVEDKNLVYFEVLSIGQALAKSDDLNRFCHKVGI